MYNVSEYYKIAAKQPVQVHKLEGTMGNVPFDESNIIQGSFHITNQCTANNDVVLGSVYTGTLTATFRDVPISRYAWVGKVITPTFYLKTERSLGVEFWEEVPLGVFTIKEAKHSAEGVSIVAYDNMIKLDKKFKKSNFAEPRKMYGHISQICAKCGIGLAQTEQEIQAMPNGNTELGIVGTKSNTKLKKYSNDIDTYRDLVYWIAQSMACFATVDRNGNLSFRRYRNESAVVDEITEAHRIAGAVFDDFTTNYTGIYVTNTADGEEIYYGYDEQELEQEIATVEGDIQDVEIALDQLAQQYQQGQITEAEYKRQKKVLDKQLKNLDKRLAWLNEALNKAQSEEDGLYMDLGENPMMQADGVGNTPTTMRKRILKALDAISYTPFTCDTVCGAHYDLGDIIRFTGGHATELGEVCCVMAYDFNMNGEYRMQGFGSDPSKGVMKSKNSKKADKADKNGVSATRVSTGANLPETGNDGDLFIQTGGNISDEVLQMEYSRTDSTSSHPISINNFSGDNNSGFNFIVNGRPGSHDGERIYFDLQGLEEGGQYHVEFDAQLTRADGGWEPGQWNDSMSFGDTTINGIKDFNEHHYSTDFTYSSANKDLYFYYSLRDDYNFTYEYRNMVFTSGNTDANSVSYYSETNNQWNNIDFVKKIADVLSGGKKIGTAKNSDGTDTNIYVPNMSGASASAAGSNGLVPAPAIEDREKYLRGDGTWQEVDASGAIELTQAEYNQLTPEQKADPNKVYYIKDAGGGGGGGGASALADLTDVDIDSSLADGDVLVYSATSGKWENGEGGGSSGGSVVALPTLYSTKEKMVGLWTDKKPLYQKTFLYNSTQIIPQNTWHNTGFTLTNCKIVGNAFAHAYNSSAGATFAIFAACDSGTNNPIEILQTRNNVINIDGITVQYTKTTDSPVDDFDLSMFGIFAPVIYSLEEREIGVWTDGKPLYQKTYVWSGTLSNNNYVVLDANIKPSSYLVHNQTLMFKVSGANNRFISGAPAGTYPLCIASNEGDGLYAENRIGYTITDIVTTVQYTKTTDVAGSGSYAELGVPAVHYDTSERVIGTWIDGKPLYQKTITGLSISINADNWVYCNDISSIDSLVNLKCYANNSGKLLRCAISEYQRSDVNGIMFSGFSGFNRTVTTIVAEYTKTTD